MKTRPRAMKVLATTQVPDVGKRFQRLGFLSFVLPKKISSSGLRRIVERHAGQPYFDELSSTVASHSSATERVIEAIYRHSGRSIGALNTVATASRAPSEILTKLARSRDASVRQHARIALVLRKAERADVRTLNAIIDREGQDPEIGDGVLWHLAVNPHTPREILLRLAHEAELDAVVQQATSRLREHGLKTNTVTRAGGRRRRKSSPSEG